MPFHHINILIKVTNSPIINRRLRLSSDADIVRLTNARIIIIIIIIIRLFSTLLMWSLMALVHKLEMHLYLSYSEVVLKRLYNLQMCCVCRLRIFIVMHRWSIGLIVNGALRGL